MNNYVTISKNLLQRIALAANRDSGRIKAVYICPARTAADGGDIYIFDYEERAGTADSSW